MFIKEIFQDSKKLKQNLLIFGKKIADVSRTYGVCHVIYILFGCFLGKMCQVSSLQDMSDRF